jgi:predicted nucleic acid-binding protein
MEPEIIVLDSWSVLAFIGGEPKGKEALELLTQIVEEGGSLMMSVVNVGEIWYTIARRVSIEAADEDVEALLKLGVHFINADWDLTRIAAAFKARYRMSYADAYAAALAKDRNALLVTGDPEFKPITNEVRIKFL